MINQKQIIDIDNFCAPSIPTVKYSPMLCSLCHETLFSVVVVLYVVASRKFTVLGGLAYIVKLWNFVNMLHVWGVNYCIVLSVFVLMLLLQVLCFFVYRPRDNANVSSVDFAVP